MVCNKTKKNKEIGVVMRCDVYQSNPLINSRKFFDLLGMRIFLLGLRGLNPHFSENDKHYDKEFPLMFIPTSKLTELFGNTKYLAELKSACKKLFDTIIEFNEDNGAFILYHLFEKLYYEPNEGLYLEFSRYMRPYILDLFKTQGYTRINVDYLFKLSSPYAIRLLELLLQYQNIKQFKEMMEIKRKLTVEEIRFALNVPEGTYSDRMNNFRKFVLDAPIKEINSRTPYIVRYETVKEGRVVVAFEFTMYTYNVPKDNDNNYKLNSNNGAIRALCSLGFSERDARAIFAKCHDAEDCFSRINRAEALLIRNKKPVENKLGFLRKAIEQDWQVGRKLNTGSAGNLKVRREKEIVKTGDTFNNSMTPIGQILKSTFPEIANGKLSEKPQLIRIGRKEMPYRLAETFIEHVRNGEFIDRVKECLLEYNTTIEKFIEICEKHGI